MALTVDGVPVSGSIGNKTYARNRAGAYQRRRTKPVNPNSTPQQNARASFRSAINAWTQELTTVQRNAWNTYAITVPWLNKAGQAMQLTGQNMFVRWWNWYTYWHSDAPASVAAPAIFNIGGIVCDPSSSTLTYDISANSLAFEGQFPLLSNAWQVEGTEISARCSAPSNASRAFRPNRFTKGLVGTVGEVPTAAINFGSITPSPYVYQAGQKAWVRLTAVAPDHQQTVDTLVGPIALSVVA